MKFFHSPHLAKHTLLLISVLSLYTSVATSCCRSEYLTMWKTRVVFIDPGTKGNSSYYCNIVLEEGLLPDIRAICRHYRWTHAAGWSASAHCPDHDGLSEKEHINFIELHMWPPNSHDINTVDYAIWDSLQQRIYHQRQFETVEKLKWAIVTDWQKLSQRFIDNSINEWRRRLEAVIKNGGGHIERCILAWAAAHHFNTIER